MIFLSYVMVARAVTCLRGEYTLTFDVPVPHSLTVMKVGLFSCTELSQLWASLLNAIDAAVFGQYFAL
jgi:N-glycosylase/DNA lyase